MSRISFLLLSCLLLAISPCFAAAETWPGQASQWHGYQRYDFSVADRPAYVVVPQQPGEGSPWVWRARFPNFHIEADLLLLKRGFHVAYINTDNMFGSPQAMEHWDKFYDFMTGKGLAKKVALEGVSRGGLFVYSWAARHPEHVACIYADTPVCDIRSWPGGLGSGIGSPDAWQRLLKEYELSDEEAKHYEKNPIDILTPIAEAKIPILHIISLNDKIVPPTENTLFLAERYRKLGGEIEIMEVKEGTAESNGHHFTHPDPQKVADFIFRHASVK